jgi:glycerophosphoryl diester phosphodiesterase
MGMNLWSATPDRQTHRENTVASFRRAAAAGVSFVEFDVQVSLR